MEASNQNIGPDAGRKSVARQPTILGIAGQNTEPRIAAGRFPRSVNSHQWFRNYPVYMNVGFCREQESQGLFCLLMT